MHNLDTPCVLALLGAGMLGVLVGSFVNVLIWRIPRGESIVAPPSACPRCGQRITARDNIPVVSWLVLRGRCRACGDPISMRYPLVEAGTAALFVLTAFRFGATAATPAYLYLAAVAVALTVIDLDTHRLPDAIVRPSYPIGLALLGVASWASDDWSALVRAVVGAGALFAFYLILALSYPRGMGWGDVKLAGLIGMYLAWIGWGAFLVGAFAAFVLGGLFSMVLLLSRRATRGSGIAFGPWMALGAAVGVAVGEPVWSEYLGLVA